MVQHRAILLARSLLLLLFVLGCTADDPAAVQEDAPAEELLVLFIGNSLTYSNNLPGLVETIASAAGQSVDARQIATGGYSLEDHWNTRVGPRILELAPDLVIMQQGPSSLPENQEYLLTWTKVLSGAIREAGGEPALLMVWPDDSRIEAFGAVHDSYRNAALAVEGRFFPAGDAFLAAHIAENLQPYGIDGFHPSKLGSTIAALSIVRTLFPDALKSLPSQMTASDPTNPSVDLGANAQQVYDLVDTAVAESGI